MPYVDHGGNLKFSIDGMPILPQTNLAAYPFPPKQEEYLATLNFHPIDRLDRFDHELIRIGSVWKKRVRTGEAYVRFSTLRARIIKYEDGGLRYMLLVQDDLLSRTTDDYAAYITQVNSILTHRP